MIIAPYNPFWYKEFRSTKIFMSQRIMFAVTRLLYGCFPAKYHARPTSRPWKRNRHILPAALFCSCQTGWLIRQNQVSEENSSAPRPFFIFHLNNDFFHIASYLISYYTVSIDVKSWTLSKFRIYGGIRSTWKWLEKIKQKNGRRIASRFVKQYFGAGSG